MKAHAVLLQALQVEVVVLQDEAVLALQFLW